MAITINAVTFSAATKNTLAIALQTLIDAGGATAPGLRIFSSTPTLLADIPLENTAPAFTVSGAVLTCDVSPVPTVNGVASGTPATWELVPQTGSSSNVIATGTFAASPDPISAGQPVNLTSFTITIG